MRYQKNTCRSRKVNEKFISFWSDIKIVWRSDTSTFFVLSTTPLLISGGIRIAMDIRIYYVQQWINVELMFVSICSPITFAWIVQKLRNSAQNSYSIHQLTRFIIIINYYYKTNNNVWKNSYQNYNIQQLMLFI